MAHFPFDEAQKRAFFDQQFAAQFAHYGTHYPTCERNIVERAGAPVGRLWIDEWRDQIRLVDAPGDRNQEDVQRLRESRVSQPVDLLGQPERREKEQRERRPEAASAMPGSARQIARR